MRRYFPVLAALCLFPPLAGPALATGNPPAAEGPPGSKIVESPLTRIDARKCQEFARHIPDADVAHRPGTELDADGKPIVPADLEAAAAITAPDSFTVDVKSYLAQTYRLPAASPFYSPEAFMGTVAVQMQPTGTPLVTFNGKPITNPGEASFFVACAEAEKKRAGAGRSEHGPDRGPDRGSPSGPTKLAPDGN